jgi:tetratricopeptide (TPR) repeat protein/MFS family permease
MTVQRTFSFWDCGEFIACSYTLGIPHPPGTPLFVLIGRLFSMIPFVDDISYRINYISVITSAFTAMLSYLLAVKLSRLFILDWSQPLNRWITYIGGMAAGFFVAFGETNWGNSVEAEVYGIALALSVLMVLLAVQYYEVRGTAEANRIKVLFFFIALAGVGIHMTTFLVVPICAVFFVLNNQAERRDYIMVCGFIMFELLLIILLANGRGGQPMFFMISGIVGLLLLAFLYKKINWTVAMAIAAVSSVMVAFGIFMYLTGAALVAVIILALLSKTSGWKVEWKTALAILIAAIIGFSVHLYLPIRSAEAPRIDENNPDRDFRTFVNFLDRKQYGSESMTERMFLRRGTWENQFGRHPNMGFWSYFEEQWSKPGWNFIPLFLLGLFGAYSVIKKRAEVGLPFLTLLLISSVGLILYMNFADGTKYDFNTGDAYLEVRNRDYFFTPMFVFFGIAMGIGITAVIAWLREKVEAKNPEMGKVAVYAGSVLVLLPGFALASNFHLNDRSDNFLPYAYAANLLDSCKQNSILFTSGDNDTFPVWCLQEVYNYRKDIRVVNLSLLNTDWYVKQMRDQYDIPISLNDEQILWYPTEIRPGFEYNQPRRQFKDRPRNRQALLTPSMHEGRLVKVQDMMVDEIVIENNWKVPIFFSSPPYAESPLKLRDHSTTVGVVYELEKEPKENRFNVEKSYDLYMNTYKFSGMENSKVYRDENATGVFISLGMSGVRLFDEMIKRGQRENALKLMDRLMAVYPEYFQTYYVLAEMYDREGDSAKATAQYERLRDTLVSFSASNPENQMYKEDLGMVTYEIGKRKNDQAMQDQGIALMKEAFEMNANNSYAFRKLVPILYQARRFTDMTTAAQQFSTYKINQSDPMVQQILGMAPPPTVPGVDGQ